jgi:hypothetical protein
MKEYYHDYLKYYHLIFIKLRTFIFVLKATFSLVINLLNVAVLKEVVIGLNLLDIRLHMKPS